MDSAWEQKNSKLENCLITALALTRQLASIVKGFDFELNASIIAAYFRADVPN